MSVRPTASQASWARAPERSNMFWISIMTWLSLHLGRRAARVVLRFIAVYFLVFAPASRRASSQYLRRVLGRTASWRERYLHIFTFAATIHDRIYLLNNRFDLFDVEVHGEGALRNLVATGNGLILMGAHLGSFEVISALGRRNAGVRIAMVMYANNAQKINAMLAAINPDTTQDIIALGDMDSMLKVQERLNEGRIVGILGDRTPGADTLFPVQILGDQANMPSGPFRVAAILRRPVLFMTGLYLGGNRYSIHFEPLADFSSVSREERDVALEAAIKRYAALLDKYCRMAPFNWFNFFDFWQSAPTSRRDKTS